MTRTTDQQIDHQLKNLSSKLGLKLELHCEGIPSRYYLMSSGHVLGHYEKKGDFYSSLYMANELINFKDRNQ